MKLHRYAVSALSLLVAQASYATVIYQQNFESLTAGNLNGQSGFSALLGSNAATQVATTNIMSYSSGAVSSSGGAQGVSFTGGNNGYIFSNTFTAQTGDVYFSFLMSFTNQTQNDLIAFMISGQATLPANGSVDLLNSGGIRITNNGSGDTSVGGAINASARGATSGATTTSVTGPGLGVVGTQGGVNFIVGRISKSVSGAGNNFDTVTLWINPTAATEGTPTLNISQSFATASVDKFYLFTGGGNEVDEVVRFDNLTLGTTYADVVSAVPEPSTYAAFFGAAAMGFAFVRRRR